MRDPKEIERNAVLSAMNNDFETGGILSASEETLQKYLWYICTERIDNETVRHRAIARALTINHLQMQMHINKLNKQNNRLQWLVAILAAASLITGSIQIYTTVKYSQQIPSHSEQQVRGSQSQVDSNPLTIEPPRKDETKFK
jgi:hypothetical protein